MDNTINVLLIDPLKPPVMREIEPGLHSLQNLVGGCIEAVYPFDDPVCIVCNEEGKLYDLPPNRRLEDYDILAGTFIVCGFADGEFTSLPPDLIDKYTEKFTPCLRETIFGLTEIPHAPTAPDTLGGGSFTPKQESKNRGRDPR
ncbi:DUF3846 domain-containing protein [Oscillospiraceae bacterium OttesenSCG-928-F05]|nr:DUF3846 domain-containing protein [Oscillospiraceae bacterium OttesenSCG-928-F05]